MRTIRPALLLLADGTTYRGRAIGAEAVACGELCFNTGMAGYQELYTDPSYYGQILICTAAHMGNYGTLASENESDRPQIRGVVLHRCSDHYSRPRATRSLSDYLRANHCPGIADLDTRALVRHLIHTGAQNALIDTTAADPKLLSKQLAAHPAMEGLDLTTAVSTQTPYDFGPLRVRARLAVLDFGIKRSILHQFATRGIGGRVFPSETTYETLSAYGADGYFLSNGPGDPAAMDGYLPTLRSLLKSKRPLFGICLGHQLLARAYGIRTYKLPFGHRGLNHPIRDEQNGRAFITTQNHGFAVDTEALASNTALRQTHIHLNDATVAGLEVCDQPAFSVQFHPEASPGPHDAAYLFDKFAGMLYTYAKESPKAPYKPPLKDSNKHKQSGARK